MRLPRVAPLAFAAAAAAQAASPLDAQEFLDRGTFVIVRESSEVGREDFAIRRTVGVGGRGGVLAVATVRYRDREYRPALELSPELEPVSYQLDVSVGGRVVERYSGQLGLGRAAARVASQEGESAREFPVRPGTVVLDDDAFHEFYFVPRATEGSARAVTVLAPRLARVRAAVVRRAGPDTVTVAGRQLVALGYVLDFESGDQRRFWFTPSGDLVRVAIPARGLVATRLAMP